jgi:hypothetical protein
LASGGRKIKVDPRVGVDSIGFFGEGEGLGGGMYGSICVYFN